MHVHTAVCAVVCQHKNRVMVKEVQVELPASSAGWDRAARSSDSLNNQQEFAECGFLSCGATKSSGLQLAASLASEHPFFFFLLSPPLAAGNRSHVAVEICPVCVLAHAFWCFSQSSTRTGGSCSSRPSGPLSWKGERAGASLVSSTQTWRASAGDGRRQPAIPSTVHNRRTCVQYHFQPSGFSPCLPSLGLSWIKTAQKG